MDDGNGSNAPPGWWLWVLFALVAAAYIIPFTLLSNVHHPTGAFLFWSAFGLSVIILLTLTVRGWTDQ